jgi:hypothetical protein
MVPRRFTVSFLQLLLSEKRSDEIFAELATLNLGDSPVTLMGEQERDVP